jgi:hypothetical protein
MGVLNSASIISAQLEKVDKKLPLFFERKGPFYAQIGKKKGIVVSKKEMRIPAEMRPNGDFGQYDPDGGSFGRGGGPLWDDMTITVQHFKKVIEWTELADIGSDSSEKSVVQAVQRALSVAFDDFRKGLDAVAMTDGRGILGTITSVSTAGSVDTYTMTTDGFGAKLVVPGQKIMVVNFSSPTWTVRVGATSASKHIEVDSVDYANKTIKMKECVTSSGAGDYLVLAGAITSTGTTAPASVYGVPYHHSAASTGYWLGLDRATFPEIRCNNVDASSGSLALAHARLLVNRIMDRVGQGAVPQLQAWMHMCQKHAYEDMAQNIMQLNKAASSEGVNLYYGDNMQLAGAPVNIHPSWDKTRIDFVDLNNWGRVEMQPIKFHSQEGRRLFEVRDVTDGSVTTYTQSIVKGSMNFFTYNPATCGCISSLAVMSGY